MNLPMTQSLLVLDLYFVHLCLDSENSSILPATQVHLHCPLHQKPVYACPVLTLGVWTVVSTALDPSANLEQDGVGM
jgi:hypothetical protein